MSGQKNVMSAHSRILFTFNRKAILPLTPMLMKHEDIIKRIKSI